MSCRSSMFCPARRQKRQFLGHSVQQRPVLIDYAVKFRRDFQIALGPTPCPSASKAADKFFFFRSGTTLPPKMSQSSSSSFKNIEPVPTGTDFLDIVLSRTQRRLPTVIRPGFKISRIRAFYARKVKYTQESFTEKLEAILTQFPRLDAIHPFHADLVCLPHDLPD